MSMPDPNNPNDPLRPQPGHDPEAQAELEARRTRSGNSAGLLWAVLLLALIAVGYWWFAGREVGPPPPAPALPAATAPAGSTGQAPATSDTPASDATARAQRPARPAAAPEAAPRVADRPPVALASNQQPDYPARALRSGVEGSIRVRIDLDPTGVPTDVQVVSRRGERSRDLDRAVLDAARSWRFEPAIRDGQAVAASVVVPVDFSRQ